MIHIFSYIKIGRTRSTIRIISKISIINTIACITSCIPTNNAILLNLDSFGWPFHRTKGIILCRCAPVQYEFDNYTSTADLTNSLDINHPPGTQSTENGTKFNMTHILSQATKYDDTYLKVDHGDDIDCDNDESGLAWEDARADFAPVIIYYG